MDRPLRLLVLAAVLGAGAWAVLRWPHIGAVETGGTAEYPELRPREYAASEAEVSRAVKAAVASLGWEFMGAGRGPGGSEVQASARGRILPTGHSVTIRIQRVGTRTRVSVASRSRDLAWDFGENARLIEQLQAALDAQIGRK